MEEGCVNRMVVAIAERTRYLISSLDFTSEILILIHVIINPVISYCEFFNVRTGLFKAHGLHARNSFFGSFVTIARYPAFGTQTQHFLGCF